MTLYITNLVTKLDSMIGRVGMCLLGGAGVSDVASLSRVSTIETADNLCWPYEEDEGWPG